MIHHLWAFTILYLSIFHENSVYTGALQQHRYKSHISALLEPVMVKHSSIDSPTFIRGLLDVKRCLTPIVKPKLVPGSHMGNTIGNKSEYQRTKKMFKISTWIILQSYTTPRKIKRSSSSKEIAKQDFSRVTTNVDREGSDPPLGATIETRIRSGPSYKPNQAYHLRNESGWQQYRACQSELGNPNLMVPSHGASEFKTVF